VIQFAMMAGAAAVSLSQQPSELPTRGVAAAPDIIVRGRKEDAIHSFVAKVARPEPGRQLSRWHQPLCFAFRGIAPTYEATITGRIREVAGSLQIPVSNPPCATNLAIVLSHNVPQIVKAMLAEHPPRFGDLASVGIFRAKRIRELLAPRAIRWFPGVDTIGEDGMPLTRRGGFAINKTTVASRIRTSTREEIVQETILIDADQLRAITMRQLADYLTFVALANPDMLADYSDADTILSALPHPMERAAPQGMTDLDRAYLIALYDTPVDRNPQEQISAIESQLRRRLGSGESLPIAPRITSGAPAF
jgi:hypothetical protein